ncbi:SRPBCC domain-containing protein [Litoribacter populi]|uniref:SRPBCC domain-containing protein n=1 Tax=Litoribacter populi TaxID=2598460 RepID=UPI00117EB5D0|nr:SRPBCC domain-containing protein [Litoribacter populi]
MKLTPKATIQIQKPIEEIFDGIVNPEKITRYFLSETSGWLEDGKELIWKFPEFPDYECIVNQVAIEQNRSISFVWDKETTVKISLEEQPDKSVIVRVEEKEKDINEANLKWLIENTEGWANFLACLKAYLEYGINLRKGAFEFMKKTTT